MRKNTKGERRNKFAVNRFAKGITKELLEGSNFQLDSLKYQFDVKALYKVVDIATYLVEYVKFWDDWEVDRFRNANLGIPLSVKQNEWLHDTDEEPDTQELEAHYVYMEKIQEVLNVDDDNSGPTYDAEPLEKVTIQTDDI
ncbi:hypothetical protein Tco_0976600 [Tanacetum coccineum]|uniref:Uncharacterized protein n=1 Tax=Tanacetum coccineum TaxID=301880 RepID=A0ABQ5EHS4_9ASTR